MSKTEFHNGWTIMIFDVGLPGKSERMMMAVKNGRTIDFNGVVIDDAKAFEGAKKFIDDLEAKEK